MKYKLIVSDFDGTIAQHGVVSQNVINAIKLYRQNGGKFVVCSGRHESSLLPALEKNGIEVDGYITLQGAHAFIDGKQLVNGGMSEETVKNLISDVHSFGQHIAVWQGETFYYENYPSTVEYASFFTNHKDKRPFDSESEFLNGYKGFYPKGASTKVPDDVFFNLINFVNNKYKNEVVANTSGPGFIEYVSANFTKGKISKVVAEYLGINENEVITIGDSLNDLTLLEYGFSIAVGNADETLKQIAKYIAPSVTDDAMSHVINKVLKGEDFI